MAKERTGEIVDDYYIGSTRIKINNAYYKDRTKEEIEKSWAEFSRYIYEMAMEIEANKKKPTAS